MKTLFIAYAGALMTLLVLDAIWLGLVARTFYRDQLGELMLPSPNFGIAAVFYVFFSIAVVALATRPGLSSGSMTVAVVHGAALGLAAYGTYDMTNLATLKNWPLAMSVVDVLWGGFVTAMAATGGYLAARALA